MASCRVSTRWRKRELAICKGEENPMSAEEKNKTLVHEFFEEAWVKGNVAAVDEYMEALRVSENSILSDFPPKQPCD
jgi:hypothetical protein